MMALESGTLVCLFHALLWLSLVFVTNYLWVVSNLLEFVLTNYLDVSALSFHSASLSKIGLWVYKTLGTVLGTGHTQLVLATTSVNPHLLTWFQLSGQNTVRLFKPLKWPQEVVCLVSAKRGVQRGEVTLRPPFGNHLEGGMQGNVRSPGRPILPKPRQSHTLETSGGSWKDL